jgi:hypothetical protein
MPESTLSPQSGTVNFATGFVTSFMSFSLISTSPPPPSAFLPFSASLPLPPLPSGARSVGCLKLQNKHCNLKKTGHSLCIYPCFILQYIQGTFKIFCISIRRFFQPSFPRGMETFPRSHWSVCHVPECNRSNMSRDRVTS